MLTAGHASTRGCRGARECTSLAGPQVGCAPRAATSNSASAGATACGQVCGAWLRSWSPAGPSAAYRASHLSPVFRLTAYRAQSSVMA